MLARDDSQRAAGGAVLEVVRESGREVVAAAALDAAGHPEAQVGGYRRLEQMRVAATPERGHGGGRRAA